MARIATGQLTLYDYNDTLVAGVAPVDPTLNSLWLDNSVSPAMMKKWNGSGWSNVGEMDPNYTQTITTIQTTLNNMADDGMLDYTDRQKLKDEIAEITGAIILDNASAPTGAALDAGTSGSYRRVRKAALASGMLATATAYTDLSTAYTTLANFLNARTPKPWDVSTTNKATPTPVDKATFRSAWLGYYNAQAALSEETSSFLSSSINTLKTTTLTALENKMLSEAEKSSIQVSLNVTIKEKGEIDATTAGFVANSNLVDKTIVSTPKGQYDTAYTALIAAMNDVLDEPLGELIADAKITAVNTAFTTYGTRISAMRTAFQTAQTAIETKVASNADEAIATALADYVSVVSYNEDMEAIQSQVDGAITTWFGSSEPTLMNTPASDWTTVELKDVHLGDLYYDDISGYAYRFSYKNAVYSWILIHDTDIADALAAANTAQDTADAKRRVFYAQPVPPYDVGDLWTQGISGDLMRATAAKAEGGAYAAGDWTRAVKYTDDSTVNNLVISDRNLFKQTTVVGPLGGTTAIVKDADIHGFAVTATAANSSFRIGNIVPGNGTYTFSAYVVSTVTDTITVDICDNPASKNFAVSATKSRIVITVDVTNWSAGTYHFVDVEGLAIGTYTFSDVKFQTGGKVTDWTPSPEDAAADAQDYADELGITLQENIDGKMESFSQDTDPGSAWTAAEKLIHINDLWYQPTAKITQIYNGTAWVTVEDAVANGAQSLAQSKRRVFTATPVTPYEIGDLWAGGTSADLMKCKITRASGAYVAADWEKAVKYTDDAAVNALEFGGRNIVPLASLVLSSSTLVSFTAATNTWELLVTNGTARGGLGFTGTNVRIPYGKGYILSFEVFSPVAVTFNWDVNNYPIGAAAWTGNDNDLGSLRRNSSTAIPANQWTKCWYYFHNSHASNTSKVDLYDGSIFGITNSSGATQTIKIRYVKGEFGSKPTEWSQSLEDLAATIDAARSSAESNMTTYITNNIQPQLDGKVESFAQLADPSANWPDAATKNLHTGDIWYNTGSKETNRWAGGAWEKLEDQDALDAANLASTKNTIFTSTPTIPYIVGDMWIKNQELYRCNVARATGSYTAGDWAVAVKYTDDSAANTAQQAADDAQADANTANGKLDDIASDSKLTGVEKQSTRNEWNAIASEAVSNSTQATTFAVSATAYQNALAALATYLNGGTALTYANVTAGSIPLWINDTNLATTTDIVGATYRTTWKGYYDARVALLNAIAAEARRLANVAQAAADAVDIGGTNIFWTSGQFTDTITNWFNNGGGLVADNTTQWNGFRTLRTTAGSGIMGNWYKLENNVEYTYSILIKSDIAFTGTSSTPVHYWAGKDNLNQSKLTVVKSSTNYLAGDIGKWKKLYVTFKLNSDADSFKPFVYFGASPLPVLNIAYLKLEKGNRATDWNPAPEDTAARIAASNLVINNLRQSLDSKQNIRMGMKLGYSTFSTVNANYVYLSGLTADPVTFAELLSDTDGSIYDSNTKTSITIPKQAVNLTGIPALTKGYLAWDNADGTSNVWFIVLTNTYVDNVMTSSKWMKRNIGAVGDNTEMVLDEAVYILGELEI